jgi:hypothetical protein
VPSVFTNQRVSTAAWKIRSGLINGCVFCKGSRIFPDLFFPKRAIKLGIHDRLGILLRLFTRKVSRGILRGDFHLNVGLDFGEPFESLFVVLVRKVPHDRADGVRIVIDGDSGGAVPAEIELPADLSRIIESVIADAQIDS